MLPNISKAERRVRFVVGSLLWLLYVTGSISGGFSHFLAVLGVIYVTTAVMNYCPYYLMFEISTNKDQ